MPVFVLVTAGALIAVVFLLARAKGHRDHLAEGLLRIETRIDEQTRQGETRARAAEDHVHALEIAVRETQSETREALERRLGELLARQVAASNDLASQLGLRFEALQKDVLAQLAGGQTQTLHALTELGATVRNILADHQTRFEQRQGEAIAALQGTLQQGSETVQKQVAEALSRNSQELGRRVETLTASTDQRLKEISGEVEKRLSEGFEKTTATFADVLKRLALIDEAQKKITELSSNVVSLQEVLADKRSRGAFGEVQLSALVTNVMPPSAFAFQHTLSNDRVVDCILFLPPPTGHVAIDAKFPLESYRRFTDISRGEPERRHAERQFKQDIRKHVQDIAQRYIVPGETAQGAVMFIPAEAVFAEIQAHHPDLVEEAQRARVWMVSPTTLMAILNTARAVLKDEATRKQVHVIQEHLSGLAADFGRFQKRMDNLARHIQQASKDVTEVHTSASRISQRFEKIERVEIAENAPATRTGAADDEPAIARPGGENPPEAIDKALAED